jgi:hypothetical protein
VKIILFRETAMQQVPANKTLKILLVTFALALSAYGCSHKHSSPADNSGSAPGRLATASAAPT